MRPTNYDQPPASRRSGAALIITLGILAVITLAVVAFVVSMRVEHLAARNTAQRTMARQYVDAGLGEAMGMANMLLADPARRCYPVQGWFTNMPGLPHCFEQDCFGTPVSNDIPTCLFRGAATNLLPGTLAAQAARVESGWISIIETNEASGGVVTEGIRAGRVSYLVVNLSGLQDVHALGTNRQAVLAEGLTACSLLSTTGNYQRVFFTQPDLTAANQRQPLSNLVTFSYDPGPDVFFTNLVAFGTRGFAPSLTNRFNLNSATGFVTTAASYASLQSCLDWLDAVSNRLSSAGLTAADAVAWNILNYIDPGQIPVGPVGAPPPYRSGYGVKDVPLINKVALEDKASNLNYSASVELWYPFVPNSSPANATLWVGIYTNQPPDVSVAPAGADFVINTPIPIMDFAGSNEFFVASMSGTFCFQRFDNATLTWVTDPIGVNGHQVWIWPRVMVNGNCVDEALVCGPTVTNWTAPGCLQFADPRANHLLANALLYPAPTPGWYSTNLNCSIPSLPLVHADRPLRSAGELRHIYAPGEPQGRLDLATRVGGACRDRFTVADSNAPVHGLVQANTPYTNIWQALLSDVEIGWTNQVQPFDCFGTLGASDVGIQLALAGAAADALLVSGGRGWTCNEELFPLVGSNLLASPVFTNVTGVGMDTRAVCNDILAGIADRVSFRGNTFLVIVCGQRLSPLGRVQADQRAAFLVVRDAFTGRWVVDHAVWLTE
jgi:hypothetical protein